MDPRPKRGPYVEDYVLLRHHLLAVKCRGLKWNVGGVWTPVCNHHPDQSLEHPIITPESSLILFPAHPPSRAPRSHCSSFSHWSMWTFVEDVDLSACFAQLCLRG